jgi:PD-(D/E)XK nuclease superfamily
LSNAFFRNERLLRSKPPGNAIRPAIKVTILFSRRLVHFGNEKLIVELKAISGELGASEEQQLRNYMTILNVQRGMLINFQQPGRKQGKTKLDIRELAL